MPETGDIATEGDQLAFWEWLHARISRKSSSKDRLRNTSSPDVSWRGFCSAKSPAVMPSPSKLPALKVLLVDDEDAVRWSLAYFISARGWQPFAHDHQADVVALVRKHAIDVALFDYRMPSVTGLDLIENLRDAGLRTPVVILSGNTYAIDRDRAKRLEVFHIMEKPPDLKKLTRVLVEAVASSRQSGH